MADTLYPYGCRQAYLFNMTSVADPPVYATGVEIPCPQSVMFPKRVNEILVKGGDSVCFVSSDLEGFDVTVTSNAIALDLEEILYGHTHTEPGTPDELLKWTTDDIPGNWGLIVKVNTKQPGGTIHVCFHRCTCNAAGGYQGAEGDTPATAEYSAVAYASPDDGKTFGAAAFFSGATTDISTTWASNAVVAI